MRTRPYARRSPRGIRGSRTAPTISAGNRIRCRTGLGHWHSPQGRFARPTVVHRLVAGVARRHNGVAAMHPTGAFMARRGVSSLNAVPIQLQPDVCHRIIAMRHHSLGRTGLFVSELCLGTMTFGSSEGIWANIGGLKQGDAERLVGQAIDAGINFIDTADVYSAGLSEQITGQALRNLKIPREDVVVATKVFGEMGKSPNSRGATRHHIIDGVKASLKRLQLDHIDLYQIHGFDPATPIDETLRALDHLVRQGPL